MVMLIRKFLPDYYDKEFKLILEDAFDDSDDRLIARVAYSVLKDEVYNSLDYNSKVAFFDYKYGQGGNKILTGPEIVKHKNNQGYMFNLLFYVLGKKYNINAFLCVRLPDYDFEAAYDTDENILYIPILENDAVLTCEKVFRIDATPWTFAHEFQHCIDFKNDKFSKDNWNNIPNYKNDLNGYYTNQIESKAFYHELLEFLEKIVFRKEDSYQNAAKNFSNPQKLKNILDKYFIDNNELDDDKFVRGECRDLSKFYQTLDEKQKKEIIDKISDFFEKTVKQKFESKYDFKNAFLLQYFKEFRNKDTLFS